MPRIMVVDDDPRLLHAAARLLPGWGLRCETFADARAALASIEREPPALVIVDIYMPHMDGFQFIARVRRIRAEVPIIAVSGDVIRGEPTNVLAMSEALGADATIRKPIAPERLKALIERMLAASAAAPSSAPV